MTTITLEPGRPVPPQHRVEFYPWRTMAVGDSFLFPAFVNHPHQTARAASRRLAPMKFTARKTRDGVRCWRIA